MKKSSKLIIFFILSSVIATTLIGCSSKKSPEEVFGLEQFQNEMKAKNYNFEIIDVDKDFLQAPRKRMKIGTDVVDIYLYNSNKSMEKDAKGININGGGYSRGNKLIKVDWIAPPHFFKKGNIIVQYVGKNEKIITDLKNVMGN